ncbi:SRPBCC family protein [Brevundimonas aurifodinae]|uniref:SRPBCC family protein n=2 Tax=Brevundimonas TaxID=41275 RepID=A0ABV1NQ81_9CAUL|nr:MAG: polyketide cyclase [Brevundimonas sp. 12-68-7]OYX33013.1 MAG: polyketide cyclase [Brevundimonas subvibrioides]
MAQETDTIDPQIDPCVATGAHNHALVLDRVLNGTPEKIWKAFMTPEILAQWFCPKPWSITDAVIEPEVGGRFAFTMHRPDGEVMPNDGVFLAVEPNRRWITTDAFVKGWLPAGMPFMVAEIVLTPLADGKTRYVATARHWSEETMKQHEAMGFHDGWGTVADQLNAILPSL